LLLVSCCNKLNSTCSFGWSCSLLVVEYGVVFHFGERLFHCMGCHSPWWTSPWRGYHRGNFISYLLLEIWIFCPTPNSFQVNLAFVQPLTLSRLTFGFCPTPNSFQVNFWLLSTPNSSQVNFWLFVHPKLFSGYRLALCPLQTLSRLTFGPFVQPKSVEVNFWTVCPTQIFRGKLLDHLSNPKSFDDIFWIFCPNQIFLG